MVLNLIKDDPDSFGDHFKFFSLAMLLEVIVITFYLSHKRTFIGHIWLSNNITW